MKRQVKIIINVLVIIVLLQGCQKKDKSPISDTVYPAKTERIISEANMTYYIDPNDGSDDNQGTSKDAPLKTFKKINQLILSEGTTVNILSAGTFKESLFLIGQGTEENPITIQFASGVYNFFPENAFKKKLNISNTNDDEDSLKSIAFYFLDCKYVTVKGNSAELIFRGKVMQTGMINCENISIEELKFDYKRPTVSELKVISVNELFADVEIHSDSKYSITDNTLVWIGEGWEHKAQSLWQEFDSELQKVIRINFPINDMRFSEKGKNKVRVHFDKNPGLKKGFIYQNRNTFRDYSANFMDRSKDILWKDVHVYFMHGMGFVSQFCENITYDSVNVSPRKSSGRTCAAWADILHFSGCKGQIDINNSYLSAANDDAVNVHGTHLRIVDSISKHKIKVRFMHHQTYGFDAFIVGDSIEFIRAKTLLPYSENKISKVEKLNEKEFLLTLEQEVTADIQKKDVIENTTWTADVTIRNSTIRHIPTRGVLITTRGKVLIENNEFDRTHMSGILISDDANGWYESGYVRDVTIRNNEFNYCGEGVINVHPENAEIIEGGYVHKNIFIANNMFKLENSILLKAKSTENIKFINNTILAKRDTEVSNLLHFNFCENVEVKDNLISNMIKSN